MGVPQELGKHDLGGAYSNDNAQLICVMHILDFMQSIHIFCGIMWYYRVNTLSCWQAMNCSSLRLVARVAKAVWV